MIANAITLIKEELGTYLETVDPDILASEVILGNIADIGEPDSDFLDEKIVITNVIVEEESSLKNQRNYQQSPQGGLEYIEPPVYLNLYLLFCATFQKNNKDGYEKALHKISLIIQFFQSKRFFNITNSPFTTIAGTDNISEEIKSQLKLRVELYSLTFEQLNHLWGSLGGKQSPSIMYKVRLVKIQELITQDTPLIEEIYENGTAL